MKSSSRRPPRPALLFILGLSGGVLVEALLFMQAHCAKIENLLRDDFRVVAFLQGKLDDSRLRVVEERVRALPNIETVRYVSPEASLSEISARDPELARSVALLGDNPLSGAFEVRLADDAIAKLPELIGEAEKIPELGDIRYKPMQARAILQVQFYHRFLTLMLSLAGFLWLLSAARLLWILASLPGPLRPTFEQWKALAFRAASSGAGTGLGMTMAAGFAYPVASMEALSAWPKGSLQLLLLLAGTLGGWMLALQPHPSPKRWMSRASLKVRSEPEGTLPEDPPSLGPETRTEYSLP